MKKQTKPERNSLSDRQKSEGGKFFPALCHTLGTLVLLAVVLSALLLTLPRAFGYENYAVVSESMEPAIPVGSLVFVERVAPADVAPGEVAAFLRGEDVVTHRVLENRRGESELITKGDANASADVAPVPYQNLIGRVRLHIPALGSALLVYSSPRGKLWVLGLLASGAMLRLLGAVLRPGRKKP